jgi:hypothetical protein
MSPRIRSKCINCGERRSCIKIQARAPLKHGPKFVVTCESPYRPAITIKERIDYEADGPMVEICRGCLKTDPLVGSTLVRHLLEDLT